jgi:hypothetical protein
VKFEQQLTYDAPPDEVRAMLADPEFRAKVCEAMHVIRHDVTVEGAGAGMSVTVDQTQPASGIPSFARKIVGDEIHIVQTESWGSADEADLLVQIPGKPGQFRGTISVDSDASGTTETVAGDIKVGLPLVAGKLEKLISDMLAAALRTENQVGRTWLSSRR